MDEKTLIGACVDGWTLIEELGHGADGVVFLGVRDTKQAAVKIFFRDAIDRNGGIEVAVERLELQLSLSGEKRHPNLVEIYSGGRLEEPDTLYLVMEAVPGCSLDKLLGSVPSDRVATLLGQLASACLWLEDNKLVHRDIKPANIMISHDCSVLTLLDLSIIHEIPKADENGRLSGERFVSTLRYSPPEFVWRKERSHEPEAWRAITFYQIGATFFEVIVGKIIFGDTDNLATLHDKVRSERPLVVAPSAPGWIIQLVEGCLLKAWRERLRLVSWNDFFGAKTTDIDARARQILLRQAQRREDIDSAKTAPPPVFGESRINALWHLNDGLTKELRAYLRTSDLFPNRRIHENSISDHCYRTEITFDLDEARGFRESIRMDITVMTDPEITEATRLTIEFPDAPQQLVEGSWTEMFNTETAFPRIKQALVDLAEALNR